MVYVGPPCTHIHTSVLVRSCLQGTEIHSSRLGQALRIQLLITWASRFRKHGSAGRQRDLNGSLLPSSGVAQFLICFSVL